MATTARASKRPINLSLNEDLVREARTYTRNLSGTLDKMLSEYVVRERARCRDADHKLDRLISAFDTLHETTGLLSDEFSSL